MILADTSVWIDHHRGGRTELQQLLLAGRVVVHDFIITELALGNLKDRKKSIVYLESLSRLPTSSMDEVMALIEIKKLYGSGLGFVDAHLIAACLFSGSELMTYDKNLAQVWARCRP